MYPRVSLPTVQRFTRLRYVCKRERPRKREGEGLKVNRHDRGIFRGVGILDEPSQVSAARRHPPFAVLVSTLARDTCHEVGLETRPLEIGARWSNRPI